MKRWLLSLCEHKIICKMGPGRTGDPGHFQLYRLVRETARRPRHCDLCSRPLAQPCSPDPTPPAEDAVAHLIGCLRADRRLAVLLNPRTMAYQLLTRAWAEMQRIDVAAFRKEYEAELAYESWSEEIADDR